MHRHAGCEHLFCPIAAMIIHPFLLTEYRDMLHTHKRLHGADSDISPDVRQDREEPDDKHTYRS